MPITINGSTGIAGIDGSAGTPALQGSDTNTGIAFGADVILASTGGTERARIDSSGRLLVGTSTARSNYSSITPHFQYEYGTNNNGRGFAVTYNDTASTGPVVFLGKTKGATVGSNTLVASGDELGQITFNGSDGTNMLQGAAIVASVDGTPGANDMPGRLVFSTTADGASIPTERMRITNDGNVYINTTTLEPSQADVAGINLGINTGVNTSRAGNPGLTVNRTTNDGRLIEFRQGGILEGDITVSGTTVSLTGGHITRWSQFASGTEQAEVLRGTVLSNIDEMCVWGEEDNEQLNRMKVSDIEGDPNVSGVFQSWDDDDETDDFYCAMTGDFIIRIAKGVTVQRGDLLMSAGDGTAKPQDDDIIRSKTIAKVTSNHVTCTYDDGSYCVPCVLMAC